MFAVFVTTVKIHCPYETEFGQDVKPLGNTLVYVISRNFTDFNTPND